MNELDKAATQGIEVLSSLEVAEMVEKKHDKLCRDILRYSRQMSTSNLGDSDFCRKAHI